MLISCGNRHRPDKNFAISPRRGHTYWKKKLLWVIWTPVSVPKPQNLNSNSVRLRGVILSILPNFTRILANNETGNRAEVCTEQIWKAIAIWFVSRNKNVRSFSGHYAQWLRRQMALHSRRSRIALNRSILSRPVHRLSTIHRRWRPCRLLPGIPSVKIRFSIPSTRYIWPRKNLIATRKKRSCKRGFFCPLEDKKIMVRSWSDLLWLKSKLGKGWFTASRTSEKVEHRTR